jgi:hypothetical protein
VHTLFPRVFSVALIIFQKILMKINGFLVLLLQLCRSSDSSCLHSQDSQTHMSDVARSVACFDQCIIMNKSDVFRILGPIRNDLVSNISKNPALFQTNKFNSKAAFGDALFGHIAPILEQGQVN